MTKGNISLSMRANYETYGVSEYYAKVGKTYRNPHFSGVKACLFEWMDRWWQMEKKTLNDFDPITIFDMACGSGEVTICILQWYEIGVRLHKQNLRANSSTDANELEGNPGRYPSMAHHKTPRNRHSLLDSHFTRPIILAADPYTADAYKERTNMTCAPLSFRDIAEGAVPLPPTPTAEAAANFNPSSEGPLETDSRRMEMVVCSFALHLIESSSEIFSLLWELSTKAKWLVILTPHKKPEIKEGWGWTKWDINTWSTCTMNDNGPGVELLKDRVHCRVYKSLNLQIE